MSGQAVIPEAPVVWLARRKRASAHPDAPQLRQNNPTGKIPLSPSGKSALPARPVLSRQEGRIAIVTNAGGDAVDAAASARVCSQGEFSRERTTARRTNGAKTRRASLGEDGLLRTAKPCGPGARCWCQVGGGFEGPTGFIRTANSPMTVTRRIRRRGERGISRKAIARGMPECLR